MIDCNNPQIKSWKYVSADSDFSIQNLPFGIYIDVSGKKIACSAIGDEIIDLAILHQLGYFNGIQLPEKIFQSEFLNNFIALGKSLTRSVRQRLSDLLNENNDVLKKATEHHSSIFKKQTEVVMSLPVQIGDYTDFYSSIDHATNVGKMFRDPQNALLPNWKHLPVEIGRAHV